MANITLKDIRQQYPHYNDMTDAQLANALHQKFYSDMPFSDFADKVGFSRKAANSKNLMDEIDRNNKLINSLQNQKTPLQQFGENHPIVGHIAAELGNAGQLVGGTLEDALKKIGVNVPADTTNYYNAYGVEPNTIDQFAAPALAMTATGGIGEAGVGRALESSGANLAPEVVSNAKLLGGLATGGALSSPGDEGNGALASVDTAGALKSGADAGMPYLNEGLKRIAGQFGQNEMARNVIKSLKNRLGDTGQSIADFLKSGYDEAMGNFHANIDNARDLAKNIPIKNFDGSPYKNVLTDYLDESKNLTPIERESRQDAMDFANDQLKKGIIPTNLNDLLLKNKTLNQDADKFYKGKYQQADGADHETRQLVQRLKNGIQDTFDKNIENTKNDFLPHDALPSNKGSVDKVPSSLSTAIQNLKDSFNTANQHYSFAHNLAKLPDANGNLATNNSLLAFLKSGNPADEKVTANLNKTYLNSGLNDLNHLSTMIGDENAKKSLASVLYNKATNNKDINLGDMLSTARKMQPETRAQVLTPEENSLLDALHQTKTSNRTISNSRVLLPFLAGTAGGIIGGGTGYAAHGLAAAGGGGVAAVLAGMLAAKSAGKALAKPNVVQSIFNNKSIPAVNTAARRAAKGAGFVGTQANKYLLPMFNGDDNE